MHLKTLIFVLGFVCGVFIGDQSKIATEIAVFSLVILIVQGGVAFFFVKKESHATTPILTCLIFFGIFLGIISVQLVEPINEFICEKKCLVYGEVIDSPTKTDNYQELKINLYKETSDYANLSVKTSLYPEFKAGDRLVVEGKVEIPQIILPTESNQKSFDFAEYQRTQGISGEMFFPKITRENNSEENSSESFIYKLINLKSGWVSRVNEYVNRDVSPLANGMLFGSASFTKEMKDTFRVAGLSHIVVLSGFNIAVVVSFVMILLKFVPLVLRVVLAFTSVILFVLMVGAEASVIRAVIMAGIALLALVSGREYMARQAIIISLFVMSIYDPNLLLSSVSFYLSFLATAGIIYISPVLEKVFEKFNISKFIKSLLITTLSAIIATLPYITYTFGFVSTFALITNAIVLPFVPITMLLSALVVVFSYVSVLLANIFGVIDSLLLKFMTGTAEFFASLPFSYIPVSLSLIGMFLIYILIIIAYFILKNYIERGRFFDEETGEEFEVFKY